MWMGCDIESTLTLIGSFAQTSGGKRSVLSQESFLPVDEIPLRHQRLNALKRKGMPSVRGIEEGFGSLITLSEKENCRVPEKEGFHILRSLGTFRELLDQLAATGESVLAEWPGEPYRIGPALDRWLPLFQDEGLLIPEAFPELKRLTREADRAFKTLHDRIERARVAYADYLQDDVVSFRDERHCLQIKASAQSKVPGLFLGSSSSGKTVFVEPLDVVEANNSYQLAVEKIRIEKEKILLDLLNDLLDLLPEIKRGLLFLFDFDLHGSFLRFWLRSEGSLPEILDLNEAYEIHEGRHPLIDERFASDRHPLFGESDRNRAVIPLTMKWERDNPVMVLSGPNGGGKTVALKTVAIIAILGRMGWPVPAGRGTRIPEWSNLMVFLGDEQDMLHDLSTFTAAMTRIKRMLGDVERGTLLFIDEAGFGTDPEEGAALATAILEYVRDSGGRAFVTTHLTTLKMLALKDPAVINASMEFDTETMMPRFTFIPGLPGSSHAIDVARAVGLRQQIIERARDLLGPASAERDDLLEVLQKMVTDVESQKESLQREMSVLVRKEQDLTERLDQERVNLIGAYEKWKNEILQDLEKEIGKLREEGSRIGKRREQKLRDRVREEPGILSLPARTPCPVSEGQAVTLKGSRVKGRVKEISSSGYICVEVEGKNLWVGADRIEELDEAPEVRASVSYESAEESLTSINIIGLDVDSSIERVESAIDRALLSGLHHLTIIHGHGTGKLRSAVREYLKRDRQVTGMKPTADNGGTEVEL